jgi:hypothetical protein
MDPGAHAMSTLDKPAALEQQIGQTRAELTLTINALEEKLAPRHLVEKGFDMVNDSIAGTDALNRGVAVVRANPVPFALIAIGAAWLIASNTGVVERVAQDERVQAARRRAAEMANEVGNRAGEYASDIANRVGLAGDSGAPGTSGGWIHHTADVAGDAVQSARDSGNALLDVVERNPLVVGGFGVLAGAVLAMLLPATRTENEWLGGLRDAVWQRAERAGQDAAAAVRTIAMNAADAAAEAASEMARNGGARPA